ncbi:MAG: class I SAM-dependent methyltransferase [Anaerolineales bacterium]|nr:class I SAM-dependent methyltransferase [Anaerolineales bacterium]
MRVEDHNRAAWNKLVSEGNEWTRPVSPEVITAARRGEWEVLLTESKPVPRAWFPNLNGCEVLCLASGGGQQGPILAAAGANITAFDNSPKQLEKDRLVAERDGLELTTIQGDMQDLSVFADESFDLIFHPVSNIFVPDVGQVWREAYRVLKFEGTLLAGMVNPVEYAFDPQLVEQGIYQLKYSLPYSDIDSITEEERAQYYGLDDTVEFSHTLETQIGGQTAAGFVIVDFYESYRRDDPIAKYIPTYFATRALKTRKLSA